MGIDLLKNVDSGKKIGRFDSSKYWWNIRYIWKFGTMKIDPYTWTYG